MKLNKIIALSATLFISYAGFSQIGVGLQSTTQAAMGLRANTSALQQTHNAVNVRAANSVKNTTDVANGTKNKTVSTGGEVRNQSTAAVNHAQDDSKESIKSLNSGTEVRSSSSLSAGHHESNHENVSASTKISAK